MEDRIARVRIAFRGDEAGRLVDHDVHGPIDLNEFAIHLDMIPVGRLRAEVSAQSAVDGNAASGNHRIAMSA